MINIKLNGQTFELFKNVSITRNLDDLLGSCSLAVSQNDLSIIKAGDLIEVFVDDFQVFKGYTEKFSDRQTNDSHDITWTSRDIGADLVDSSVPDNVKMLYNVSSIKNLLQLTLTGLGLQIPITDNVNAVWKATNEDQFKAASVGEGAFNFVQDYARKSQVFMNVDGKGNILISRPNEADKLKTMLINVQNGNNNILTSDLDVDYTERFGKVILRSNVNVSASDQISYNLGNKATSIDKEIRSTRFHEQTTDKLLSASELQKAADEENNIRRARGFKYSVTVAGFSSNGELWNIGKFVNVKDTKKGVVGWFLIKNIRWDFSEGGEITSMELTYPDAYKVTANFIGNNQIGTTYTVVSGDSLYKIASKNNISVNDLIQSNPQIKNSNVLEVGQSIRIPSK
jgi:prophage tail gpP-like protein